MNGCRLSGQKGRSEQNEDQNKDDSGHIIGDQYCRGKLYVQRLPDGGRKSGGKFVYIRVL